MIDRDTLHPILHRALAADEHDVTERGMQWDPHAAATAVLDALEAMPTPDRLVAMGMLKAADTTRRDQERDFAEAHAEGLHDDIPREGCPECESRTDPYRSRP
jgi:hypothetical protein